MLISSIAFLAGATMVMRPDAEPAWPGPATLLRLAIATVILVAYAYALKPLGFLLPTAIASAALSYQIRPKLRQSFVIGLGLAGGLFLIFKYALGLGLFALPRWLMG